MLKLVGIFLYADTEKAKNEGRMERDLPEAGFTLTLREITGNVVDACRADCPRRREVLARRAPLRRYHLTAARPA